MKIEILNENKKTYKPADKNLTNPTKLVRESCAYAASIAKHTKINKEQIAKYIKELDPKKVKKYTMGSQLPFKFDSLDQQIDYHVLYAATQFGSGYRHLLHKFAKRGASDTMMYGIVSMIVSNVNLDAYFMNGLSEMDIEKYYRFPVFVDKPHPTNKLLKIQGFSELKPLADALLFIFHDCGRVLRERLCDDFAQFVRKSLNESKGSAVKLVEDLVKTFPVFNDCGKTYDGKDVYFFHKAQLCVMELYLHLRSKDKLFDFKDIHELTALPGSAITSVLAKDEVLVYDDYLSAKIRKREIFDEGPEETEIRACAVHACEEIVKQASGAFTAMDLNYYLWRKSRTNEYKYLERHYCPSIFY